MAISQFNKSNIPHNIHASVRYHSFFSLLLLWNLMSESKGRRAYNESEIQNKTHGWSNKTLLASFCEIIDFRWLLAKYWTFCVQCEYDIEEKAGKRKLKKAPIYFCFVNKDGIDLILVLFCEWARHSWNCEQQKIGPL